MRNALIVVSLSAASLFGAPAARAQDQALTVSVGDVLAMMDTMPAAPGDPKSRAFRWSTKKAAPSIARAIAVTAPNREWAARMAVYTVHESALIECVAGDGGKSWGVFQLQGVPSRIACDPAQAAPIWLARARQSIADCAALPPSERMAELASGSCGYGHMIARLRETFVLRALAQSP